MEIGASTRFRCLLLGLLTAGVGATTLGGCLWALRDAVHQLQGPSSRGEDALVALCAALGAIATAMTMWSVLAGVADAWRGSSTPDRPALRRWVALVCGVGIGAMLLTPLGVASAAEDPAADLSSLSGLPLPEQPQDPRPPTPTHSPTAPGGQGTTAHQDAPQTLPARPPATDRPTSPVTEPSHPTQRLPQPEKRSPAPPKTPGPQHVPQPRTPGSPSGHEAPRGPSQPPGARTEPAEGSVVVRPGDTLWDLAAAELGADASNARIAARWQRWYAINAAAIGPDPDLLYPGTHLTRPAE